MIYKKIEMRFLIIGIVLISILISRQIIVQNQINLGKNMAKAINISGKQRMLSQKIAKNVLMLYENQDYNSIKYYLEDLESSLYEFENSHYNLINSNKAEDILIHNSSKVISLFNEIDPYFKNILETGKDIIYLLKQDTNNNDLILEEIKIIVFNEKSFLENMQRIVNQYEYEAENGVIKLKKIESLIFYLIILTFILIGIFIFLPTSKILKHSFLDINEINENMNKLFYTMKGALFLVNKDGEIIISNSDAEKIMSISEVKTRNITEAVKWLNINIANVIKDVLDGEELENLEVKIENIDDIILTFKLSAISGKYNGIDSILINAFDITDQKNAEEVLKGMATKDELTGLHNRYFLDLIIGDEINKSNRYDYPLSALILDIDNFKNINDTWGHPVGDIILKEIARVLIENSRESDYQLRIGGEEFVVLMSHTNLEGAYIVAEKFRKAIENNIHPIVGKYTASFGVAERKVDENYIELYNRIDKALYEAKHTGKNCVVKSIVEDKNHYINNLEWKNSWNSGELNIDLQHQEILNKLQTSIKEKSTTNIQDKITDNLNLLMEEIEAHFKYEEKVLKEIGYANVSEHKKIHFKLLEKAYLLIEKTRNDEIDYEGLLEFMYHDLIMGHLLNEDTKFFKDIKNNQNI